MPTLYLPYLILPCVSKLSRLVLYNYSVIDIECGVVVISLWDSWISYRKRKTKLTVIKLADYAISMLSKVIEKTHTEYINVSYNLRIKMNAHTLQEIFTEIHILNLTKLHKFKVFCRSENYTFYSRRERVRKTERKWERETEKKYRRDKNKMMS